jgi:hypothetical protein
MQAAVPISLTAFTLRGLTSSNLHPRYLLPGRLAEEIRKNLATK